MDLTRIAQDVLAFVTAEGLELPDDLGRAEAVLQEQVRRIGVRALERHLQGGKLGYEGSSRACVCKGNQRFVEHRPKTVATLLGSVTLRRAYYRCEACGPSSLPYDERVGLGATQVSVGLATKRKAIDALMTYVANQDDRLAYDRFRARGFDIGSGRVEAACKSVVGTRMKRSGMRWSAHGAQATLSPRVAWLNGTWDRLWESHPLAA